MVYRVTINGKCQDIISPKGRKPDDEGETMDPDQLKKKNCSGVADVLKIHVDQTFTSSPHYIGSRLDVVVEVLKNGEKVQCLQINTIIIIVSRP